MSLFVQLNLVSVRGVEPMFHVLLGCVGFVILWLFELVSLRGGRPLKWLVLLSGGVLIGFSFVRISLAQARLPIPSAIALPSWLFAVLFLFLFVYSNFLEIPFRQTYVDAGVGTALVKTGTYALTRHPGVLWVSLMMVFLILATRSKLLLVAGPVWIAMDVIWVWLQDRFYLESMFPGYGEYKAETPMLVPTRESLRKCLDTLGGGKIPLIRRR